MTLTSQIKVGNKGTITTITMTKPDPSNPTVRIPVDLSTATGANALVIRFKKPTGGEVTLTASKVNPPGVNGKMRATDDVGIFTVRGRWSVRGEATFDTGNILKGSWRGFTVGD